MKNDLLLFNGVAIKRMANLLLTLQILLLSGYFQLAAGQTTPVCIIETDTPCPSDIVTCATQQVEGVWGATVSWTPPEFSLSCGSDYAFEMSFNLPESQGSITCWEYNKVQRTGQNGGQLNINQSSGSRPPHFISPRFYLVGPTSVSITLKAYVASTLNIYLIKDAYTSPVMKSVDILPTSPVSDQVYTFDIPLGTDPIGAYKIMFVFIGPDNNTTYCDIQLLQIDAAMSADGCSGDVNFSTQISTTGGPGDFFPVGTTPVTYTATYRDGAGAILEQKTCSFNVTVNHATPEISVQPLSETVCAGSDVTFSVTASSNSGGGTLNYQWKKDGTAISGATSASLPITGVAPGDAGSYTVDVYNDCASITSNAAVLTVHSNFTAGVINATGETVCYSGNPGVIGSTTPASGGNGIITYEWRAGGVAIPNSNTETYDPPAGLTTNTTYTRWAKDGLCNTTFTQSTGNWVVTVHSNFNAGVINATGETVCYNGNPVEIGSTTAASGGNGSITYEWRANGNAIPSSNSATYDPPAGITTNTTYTRWAKDGLCNTTFTQSTGSWVVTVHSNFTAGVIHSTGETVCYNGNPGVIGSTTPASGGNGIITYEWRANGNAIPNSNSATYDPPGLTTTTTYTRWAKDGLCNTTFTQSTGSWVVTVHSNFNSGVINSTGETVCYNGNPGVIGSTTAASGGNGVITYEWRAGGVAIPNSNSVTYDPPAGITSNTTYTRWAKDGLCNTTFTQSSGSWVVTVKQEPLITTQPLSQTICVGGPVTFSVAADTRGGGDLGYQWKKGGTPISGATNASLAINTVSAMDAADYTVVVSNSCGFIESDVAKLMVQAVTVTPNSQQYSDLVSFSGIIYNGASLASTVEKVSFFIGTQNMGTANMVVSVSDLVGELLDVPLLETTPAGQLAPGEKTVKAEFMKSVDVVQNCIPTTTLTINPEKACAIIDDWETTLFVNSNSKTGGSAEITVVVILAQEDDDYPGVFPNNLNLTFNLSPNPNVPVVPVPGSFVKEVLPSGDLKFTAKYTVSLTSSVLSTSIDVTWAIGGSPAYFTHTGCDESQEVTVVTVSAPADDFLTGGGYIVLENPTGTNAGTIRSKTNFGFNAKWNTNSKAAVLQGNFNAIFRIDGTPYQIKSNKPTTIKVDPIPGTDPVRYQGYVVYSSAILKGFGDNKTSSGSATVYLWVEDHGEPGVKVDNIGFAAFMNKSTVPWFSTNTFVSPSVTMALDDIEAGNIQVRKSGTTPPKKSAVLLDQLNDQNNALLAYPNPFSQKLNFDLTSSRNSHAMLEIFDSRGARIVTLLNRRIEADQQYLIEYVPVDVSSGMLFYRLTLDNEVINGKVIYNRQY